MSDQIRPAEPPRGASDAIYHEWLRPQAREAAVRAAISGSNAIAGALLAGNPMHLSCTRETMQEMEEAIVTILMKSNGYGA